MALAGRRERLLDGREVMELWVKLESTPRIARLWKTEGRINPRTRRPYTQSGIWRAAMIFVATYPDEAREYYRRAGDVKSDEEWRLFVLRKAMLVWKNARITFMRWAISNEWPLQYKALFEEEMAIGPEDWDYFKNTTREMPRGAGRQKNPRAVPE